MRIGAEGELRASLLSTHEARILHAVPAGSFRGIRHPDIAPLGDIATAIRDKVVGDIGSGFGGLAKTAFIEGIPTAIWSVNPRLRQPHYNERQRDLAIMARRLAEHYQNITTDQIQAAQRYHDAHMSTNFAHNLFDFPDVFFDLLIDNFAVHGYMLPNSSLLYELTIDEMLRVLKPGGEIIVGHARNKDLWEETGIGKTVLDRRNIPYHPILHPELDSWKAFPGVTILKPAA